MQEQVTVDNSLKVDNIKQYFTVYVKTDCEFCSSAVELLDKAEERFIVIVMDKFPEYLDKMKKDLNHNTVPMIFCTNTTTNETGFIGGFSDLEKSFGVTNE